MQEINLCVENQRRYFNSNATKSYDFRIEQLKKLRATVLSNEKKITEALKKDLGKSKIESFISEIGIVIKEIDFALKNLKKWMKPRCVSTSLSLKPASAKIFPEPIGVTLIISPWNYPFQLAIAPIVGAIAAGNTVILKPSELSIETEKLLKEMINLTFDSQYIHVFTGGKDVGQELLKKKFDFIFFTGSTEVGKIVMKAASENLTQVCLELGGKSPCIVDESADLEVAARRIVWGKFFNAGQTCIAPDYLYIHESIKTTFVALLKKNIRNFYGENELKSSDYGRIISKNHFDRISKLIDGSKILYGGDRNKDELFIAPTLLEVKSWDEKVMKEEIFGPVLPILPFTNLEDVVATIKSKDKPLALYIFSTQNKNIEKIQSELSYGGGCINDCLVHFSSTELPVGGIGASGFGRYHGKFSFDTFTHEKAVVRKSNFFDFSLRYPPYTDKKQNLMRKILK